MDNKTTVCIVGSINKDLTITTEKIPMQGETVLGNDFDTYPGGMGANQAVAAARLGANVNMIGAVGEDPFGTELLEHLETERSEERRVGKEVSAQWWGECCRCKAR